jgi:hypothetical protein
MKLKKAIKIVKYLKSWCAGGIDQPDYTRKITSKAINKVLNEVKKSHKNS